MLWSIHSNKCLRCTCPRAVSHFYNVVNRNTKCLSIDPNSAFQKYRVFLTSYGCEKVCCIIWFLVPSLWLIYPLSVSFKFTTPFCIICNNKCIHNMLILSFLSLIPVVFLLFQGPVLYFPQTLITYVNSVPSVLYCNTLKDINDIRYESTQKNECY